MSHVNYILKSAVIIFIASLIARVLGYVTKVIIARDNQEVYGLYSLGNSIILFLIPLVVLGLNIGLNRYLGFYQGKNQKDKANLAISTALKIVIPLSIALFLVLFFFSNQISHLFKTENLDLTLKLFSILIPLTAISYLFFSILTVNKKIKQLVFTRDILQGTLEMIFVIIVVYLGLNITGIAFALILSSILAIIFSFNYCKNLFSFKIKGFDKSLLQFSLSAFIIFVFVDIINKIDTIILGHYVNINQIAVYNVAVPTAQMILIFSLSLLAVFLPTITEKHAQKKSISEEYKSVTRWTLLLTYPIALLMVIFSTKIIEILFGQNYISAAFPLSILAFSLFLLSLSRPAYNVLLMLKKTNLLIKLSLAIIIIDIILNFLLVKLMISNNLPGMYGSAIATGFSFILLSILTSRYAHKYTKIRIFNKNELKIILSGIIATLPLILIKILSNNESLFHIAIYLIIFLVIYIIMLFLLNCFDKEDKRIFDLVKNKLINK